MRNPPPTPTSPTSPAFPSIEGACLQGRQIAIRFYGKEPTSRHGGDAGHEYHGPGARDTIRAKTLDAAKGRDGQGRRATLVLEETPFGRPLIACRYSRLMGRAVFKVTGSRGMVCRGSRPVRVSRKATMSRT